MYLLGYSFQINTLLHYATLTDDALSNLAHFKRVVETRAYAILVLIGWVNALFVIVFFFHPVNSFIHLPGDVLSSLSAKSLDFALNDGELIV